MNEPFQQFVWYVHPAYQWRDWLDSRGRPVTVPEQGLTSLESPSGVERAWQQAQDKKRLTGPVLCPQTDGKAREYHPMQRPHNALFQEFAGLDYEDRKSILAFAAKYGLLGVEPQHQV